MSRVSVVCLGLVLFAGGSAALARDPIASDSLVARFKARPVRMPVSYRARRHLEAENPRFKTSGWVDVVTEFQAGRMTYAVTGRGGSDLVQNRVLIPALDGERELWEDGPASFALTETNYRFEDAAQEPGAPPRIRLVPRRKDERLVDGWLSLTPTGEVLQVSGQLAKSPSFWTKSAMLTQRYAVIHGVHLPVSVTSIADVRLVGRSTFKMTYNYEMVDGARLSQK